MAKIKSTKKYYFSVEGETERWYLKWLEGLINSSESAKYKVSIDCPVQKDPLKRAKSMVLTGKTEVWHLSDYESDADIHTREFTETMDKLRKAKDLGKQIVYRFGYSNLTFDLWIVLHKSNYNTSLAHRRQYLTPINSLFQERFESMAEYKHEKNFKRCLSKLSLSDVVDAVSRAKEIMNRNKENGYILHEYKGYYYYKENPSLAIWEAVEKILIECKLISS